MEQRLLRDENGKRMVLPLGKWGTDTIMHRRERIGYGAEKEYRRNESENHPQHERIGKIGCKIE